MTTKQHSIFYHVPLWLVTKLEKYRTQHSLSRIGWKNRDPKNGYRYGPAGKLRREHAQSASLYVSTPIPDHYLRSIDREYEDFKTIGGLREQRKGLWDELDTLNTRINTLHAHWVVRTAIWLGLIR